MESPRPTLRGTHTPDSDMQPQGTPLSSISPCTCLPGDTIWDRRAVTQGTYLWSHKHINTFPSSHALQRWPWGAADGHTGETTPSAGRCSASTVHPGRKWVPDVAPAETFKESGCSKWASRPGSPAFSKPWTMLRKGGEGRWGKCKTILHCKAHFQ